MGTFLEYWDKERGQETADCKLVCMLLFDQNCLELLYTSYVSKKFLITFLCTISHCLFCLIWYYQCTWTFKILDIFCWQLCSCLLSPGRLPLGKGSIQPCRYNGKQEKWKLKNFLPYFAISLAAGQHSNLSKGSLRTPKKLNRTTVLPSCPYIVKNNKLISILKYVLQLRHLLFNGECN